MIDPRAVVSYAQFREDIVLYALLGDIKKGFYVDVGANYPIIDSVTKLFYDRGWSGINVEPITKLYEELKIARPRDVNLNYGLGAESGSLTFYEDEDRSGHSSFVKEQVASDRITEKHVKIRTLKNVLSEFKPKNIHFMKIDVEGFEYEVIEGNDWKKYRPEVLCVESNHSDTKLEAAIIQNNYKIFIKDGLNNYYIANESWYRTEGYAERVINIDYHALRQHHYQSWRVDSKMLKKLDKLNSEKETIIQQLLDEIQQMQDIKDLSLKNVDYPRRLKRVVKGLSIDWVRYKKNS